MAYDVARIREEFPILTTTVQGHPLVYLDTAASAQKPRAVLDRMRTFYETEYANVHRGLHHLSTRATEAFEEGREAVREFLNASDDYEIIFTRNATEAINLVATSFGGQVLSEGDEVVLSILEHHSNIVPWHFHRERRGVVLKWAPIDGDGNLLLDGYDALLGPKTKMVAMTQMSNALGTVVPIEEVIARARVRGIPVLVDGSQACVHGAVDVGALGCDFYVFTGHKTYGPSGIGVLCARKEWLERMPPYQGGGEMILEVGEESVTYADLPHRFEAGTPAICEVVGLGAALCYLKEMGMSDIAAHEADVLAYAEGVLSDISGVTVVGAPRERGPILPFVVEGIHPHDVSVFLDHKGVAVRAGTHCTMPLLKRLGHTATCRASFGMYTTREEIDRLGQALLDATRFFA